ncbi:hypothetical protein [Stutzerimonas tarimensis]|uniref:Uncharacterized protein n=1 Tax=Stutzerimonas tarimensis TaxID=1507735 RepID=A0ABV7T3P6_9GAMM
MQRYEIAFNGALVPGVELEQVQVNLARLFQADAQRIAALFSGRRTVIKQNLDEAAAEKYRLILERAGARVEVSPMADVQDDAADRTQPGADLPPSPAARLEIAPRDDYMAAFIDVDAPDFGLAPAGSDLLDPRAEVPEPALDLSALSLAPVGSDLGQRPADPAAPAPDTSHLSLVR